MSKKHTTFLLFAFVLVMLFSMTGDLVAQTETYVPLSPIPGVGTCLETDPNTGACIKQAVETTQPGSYLKNMFLLGIGIAAVLAVIMITIGGIMYITSAAFSTKEEAKKRIWAALGGFILVLAAWLILNTINPDFLRFDFSSLGKTAQQTTTPPQPSHCIEWEVNGVIDDRCYNTLAECQQEETAINNDPDRLLISNCFGVSPTQQQQPQPSTFPQCSTDPSKITASCYTTNNAEDKACKDAGCTSRLDTIEIGTVIYPTWCDCTQQQQPPPPPPTTTQPPPTTGTQTEEWCYARQRVIMGIEIPLTSKEICFASEEECKNGKKGETKTVVQECTLK